MQVTRNPGTAASRGAFYDARPGRVTPGRARFRSLSSIRYVAQALLPAQTGVSALRGVRGDALAKGPVLLGHLDEADQDVVGPHVDRGLQAPGNVGVQILLDLDGPPGVERDLDDHQPLAPLDPAVA